jgi:hypothetical protein
MSSVLLSGETPAFNISEFDIFQWVEKNPQGSYRMLPVTYRATKVPFILFR